MKKHLETIASVLVFIGLCAVGLLILIIGGCSTVSGALEGLRADLHRLTAAPEE